MESKHLAVVFGVLSLAACQSTEVAQSTYRSGADHLRVAAHMSELATPGPEHAELAKRAGTWEVELRTRLNADSEWQTDAGTATYRPVLGGRYMMMELKAAIGGEDFEAIKLIGYDKLAGGYESVWADTATTWLTNSVGDTDVAHVTHMHGVTRDVVSPEGRPFRSDQTKISDNEYLTEFYDTVDGDLVKLVEIRETRRS